MFRPHDVIRLLRFAAGVTALATCAQICASELIDAGESAGAWRPLSGRPTPRVESSPNGHDGTALRIAFHEGNEAPFVGRAVTASESWNRGAGLSFWWRGDGSDGFVAVTLLDETLTRRHAALVSLRNKEWQRIRLRWDDFVPETFATDWFGAPGSPMQPCDVHALWFGRWFYLRPWSSCSFDVDEIRIEDRIDTPSPDLPESPGISRTLAKLATREKVVIAALGDSITSGYRLEKPEREAWPAVLKKLLRSRFEHKDIEVRNLGIGGLETRPSIALLPRDIGSDPPDLAVVHFGYNDLTAMEERRIPEEARPGIVARNFRELVQRIRVVSHGRTEVLLIATIPGADRARRSALDFVGQAAAETARDLRCGYTDAPRTLFREILERDGPKALFAQLPDGRQDVSHPHAAGQRVFAEALLKAFEKPDDSAAQRR